MQPFTGCFVFAVCNPGTAWIRPSLQTRVVRRRSGTFLSSMILVPMHYLSMTQCHHYQPTTGIAFQQSDDHRVSVYPDRAIIDGPVSRVHADGL